MQNCSGLIDIGTIWTRLTKNVEEAHNLMVESILFSPSVKPPPDTIDLLYKVVCILFVIVCASPHICIGSGAVSTEQPGETGANTVLQDG